MFPLPLQKVTQTLWDPSLGYVLISHLLLLIVLTNSPNKVAYYPLVNIVIAIYFRLIPNLLTAEPPGSLNVTVLQQFGKTTFFHETVADPCRLKGRRYDCDLF